MIKLLPFVLVLILTLGGLGYWRHISTQTDLITSEVSQQDQAPIEVPKTLPGASLEDRVLVLEDLVAKFATELNSLKSQTSQTTSSISSDSRVLDLEASATELKARVSVLEKSSPVSGSTSKYPLYIPLGAGGGPWNDQSWTTLNEYQVAINPDNYQGYSGMQLEANFRLAEPSGTGSVRLYNATDGSSVSSQVDTTSTSFGVQTSATFKLDSGQKTYTIQIKSSETKILFVQSARIKVNF
ncbi:hypothetical protein KKE78_02705 [Patescibacteria group bacterium]|nr:hypothetical protein [Patescibacteria group bacterium]